MSADAGVAVAGGGVFLEVHALEDDVFAVASLELDHGLLDPPLTGQRGGLFGALTLKCLGIGEEVELLTAARAGVLLVPGRDWTSMPVGRAYMQEFLNRIRDAAVDTAAHRMKGGARMDFGRVM